MAQSNRQRAVQIAAFGTWAVTERGVECTEGLDDDYLITNDRVHEDFWIEHMAAKKWVVMSDFEAALAHARSIRR